MDDKYVKMDKEVANNGSVSGVKGKFKVVESTNTSSSTEAEK